MADNAADNAAEGKADSPRVVALWISPVRRQASVALESARVLDNGLEGDAHAKADSDRQVLLMDLETIEALALAPGDLKENITISGFPLYDQPWGRVVRVGGALLRLTGPCAPCGKMEQIRPGLRAELSGRRGVLARVVEAGEVRVGDAIAPS